MQRSGLFSSDTIFSFLQIRRVALFEGEMGSGGSKAHSGSSSSSSSSSSPSSSGRRRGRSKRSRVFQSSCFSTASRSCDSDNDDQVCNHQNKENGSDPSCTEQTETEPDEVKTNSDRKVKVENSDGEPCVSSNDELDGWGEASIGTTASRTGSTSAQASSTQSLSTADRILSRFSSIPGNVSLRLNRASSLGSSRSYRRSSTSLAMLNNEECLSIGSGSAGSFLDRIQTQQVCDSLPASLSNGTLGQVDRNPSARDTGALNMGLDVNLNSPRTGNDLDSVDTRTSDRWIGAREPVERNVRFSRTLSVGRLRDRVLRRSSLSEFTFYPLEQVREIRDASLGSGRQILRGETRLSATEGASLTFPSASGHPPSNISDSFFGIQGYDGETPRPREARYHDLLEHRSNFLERRRRIRSQVRALQRLGSRFENLSGHERTCILSGQHRRGRCTCRSNNRDANLNDDSSTRASISRIVMLAEALFEVLDEIHQQSVVLSSRPSVSSIGSVPAPNNVVDSLPVKSYTKSQRHQNEEVSQCYICLVEYEDGDSMRILPCHHEFHKTCVDKWLKEIHRVCPLCRGDICRSDSVAVES